LAAYTALIMGGTWDPLPDAGYVSNVDSLYIAPNFPKFSPSNPTYTGASLYTPEQFWPATGPTDMTENQSVAAGLIDLQNAMASQFASGNSVVVFGYSQSAEIVTMEMNHLATLPANQQPNPSQLSFVLVGDPNNPNGGLLTRFPGFYIPILDVSFGPATPPDSPYATAVYTLQYDGISDAPQYPLNLLADLNAFLGYFYVHGTYPGLAQAQLATAQKLPTSPGYTGNTSYYLIPTPTLPLLDPLIQIGVPKPVIDLIQPVLKVLVDLGYGNGYADVVTPAGLFPNVNPLTVLTNLSQAVIQGVTAALSDIGIQVPAAATPTKPLSTSPAAAVAGKTLATATAPATTTPVKPLAPKALTAKTLTTPTASTTPTKTATAVLPAPKNTVAAPAVSGAQNPISTSQADTASSSHTSHKLQDRGQHTDSGPHPNTQNDKSHSNHSQH
jgi:hypothetical protein